MQKFITAEEAIQKLREKTGITNDDELARKIGVPTTAIRIYLNNEKFKAARQYKNILYGAERNLGLKEDFFYESEDPTWAPAPKAEKIEVVAGKAVKPEPKAETPVAEAKPVPKPVTVSRPVSAPVTPIAPKAESTVPAAAPAGSKASSMTPEQKRIADEAVKMLKAGMTRKDITDTLNIGKTTFYKYLRLAGVDIQSITSGSAPAPAPAAAEAPAEEAPVITEVPAEKPEEAPAPAEEAAETVQPEAEKAEEPAAEAPAEEAPAAEPETEEAPAEEPAVTLTEAVEDKAPAPAEAKGTSIADTIAKGIAADIEQAIAEAAKKAGGRAEKLTALVEKAAALPDGLLDALVAIAGSMK